MNFVRILVDGYSMLHACRDALAPSPPHSAKARDWLIRHLTQYQDITQTPITVFFDGMGSKADKANQEIYPHLEVLFSRNNKTADDMIERVTHKLLSYGKVLVVTDDYAEQNTITSMGGNVASCGPFFETIQDALEDFRHQLTRQNGRSGKTRRRSSI